MYRFQYDGRLQRSLETGACAALLNQCYMRIMVDLPQISAIMLMESFNRVSRKEKYAWDVSDIWYSFRSVSTQVRMLQMFGHVRLYFLINQLALSHMYAVRGLANNTTYRD